MHSEGDIEHRLSEYAAKIRAGESIESCLEECEPELRALVEYALRLRSVRIRRNSRTAFESGRARMHKAREAQEVRSAKEARKGLALLGSFAAIILIALGLTLAGYSPLRASPTEAQVEGILHSVQGNILVIATDEGQARIPSMPAHR